MNAKQEKQARQWMRKYGTSGDATRSIAGKPARKKKQPPSVIGMRRTGPLPPARSSWQSDPNNDFV